MTSKLPKQTTYAWEEPEHPMDRVHIDFAVYKGHNILVFVDAKSHWMEARLTSGQKASHVTDALSEIFASLGIPKVIVSDGGPAFDSEEFRRFLKPL
jgi:hypothetical protein